MCRIHNKIHISPIEGKGIIFVIFCRNEKSIRTGSWSEAGRAARGADMMSIIIHALQVLLPLPYLLSMMYYLRYFERDELRWAGMGRRILLISLFIHFAFLVLKWLHFRQFPVTNPAESLSLISFSVAFVYAYLEKIGGERKTGVFFLGFAAFTQLPASMFMPLEPVKSSLLANPFFAVHTLVTVTGLSALAISAIYGLMYIMLAQKLRQKRFGRIYENLPALETLENLGRKSSLMGLVFLGVGILMGHYWAHRILENYFPIDPKIILTDIAWLAYVVMWFVVKGGNIRGLRPGRWAFWGFILLLIGLALSAYFGDSFHNFSKVI